MYRLLFTVLLRHLDPERAHDLAQRALRMVRSTAIGRRLIARWSGAPDPRLEVRALGLRFSSPLGVAAGLDKEGTWFEDLAALGFSFVEVGTVTARAQSGNPRPRIARSVSDRALINRMGFPNPGAAAVARNVARPRRGGVVGVNVGKSRAVSLDDAGADYREAVRSAATAADYVAINVSSPNTPGLRDLQSSEQLRDLVGQIRDELRRVGRELPLLVKISPDLDDREVDEIAQLACQLALDGIIAVNTTVARGGLSASRHLQGFSGGGVSGPPLAHRAEAVLRRLHAIAGQRLVLVSVGGIESADDVWRRLEAGATLVQAYTALIYHGPAWPRRVNRELSRRLAMAGLDSIQAVGRAAIVAGDSEAQAAAVR